MGLRRDESEMLRRAEKKDISRIAEILIFGKRMAYRPIFRNDAVSFNEMQVLPLAEELSKPGVLARWLVYDDGIVRGVMERGEPEGSGSGETVQLYSFFVDPFFQQMGYGKQMMKRFLSIVRVEGKKRVRLWVLEKNDCARRFYENAGFAGTGERKPEDGTAEYILCYEKKLT